jgi:type I restriction enzyme S subunit
MSASWEVAPLRELLEVQNGYAFDAKKFTAENGVPLIRIRDLKVGDGTETNYTGQFDLDYLVNDGDLLIGMDGEFRCHEWKGPPSLLNQRVCRLRNFKGNLEPRFLYYGINKYLEEIEDATSYTTVKHLSSKTILGIEFPHPPLPEQQRIVGKLDAAFTALTEAQAHVERNRTNARELFESYLNGVFEGKGDGWVEQRLGDLIDIQNGYAFSSNEYKDEGHFLIRISNVQDGEITLANPKYVAIDDPRLKRFILNEGDILVSLTGNIGRVGVMQAEHLPAALNQRVARITLKDDKTIRHNFLFFFLRSNFFREHLQSAGHGAAQQNVSTKEIAEVELSLPPLAEQQRVLDALRELQIKTDELETTYQQKLSELAGLKKAVLGAAFRGEL